MLDYGLPCWRKQRTLTIRTMTLKKKIVLACAGLVTIVVAHVVVFWYVGLHDTTHAADAIVILANTVNPDGSMSDRLKSRIDKGLELYQAHYAPLLVVSGGMGKEGYNEARVMQNYLREHAVPATDIVVDDTGVNTQATAEHTAAMAKERNWHAVIVVTQPYHILRSIYAFHRAGVPRTYHAHATFYEIRDAYSTARDIVGFYDYLLFRNWSHTQ